MIRVEAWGVGASVVDEGRLGRASFGAGRGGAVDAAALRLANRLLGNPPGAAGIETSGGTTINLEHAAMVAITGAVADVVVVGGPPVGWGAPIVLPAGAKVRVGRLVDGARTYLGVRGGLGVDADRLEVGPDPGTAAALEAAPRQPSRTTIRVWPGPRLDWFDADAWHVLTSTPFTVAATNRVGTRLAGLGLGRVRRDELASEGLLEGAVQVPPDGQPIVMLAAHPTTGGYPVVAVVDPDDIAHVAQAALGTVLRFTCEFPQG